MKRGQNKSGAIKGALYAIAIFNFLNLFLHVFSFYKPIIFSEIDYGLYGVKILLYFLVYGFLKRNTGERFRGYCNMLLATAGIDILELLISVINCSLKLVPFVIMFFIGTKYILNFLSYKYLIGVTKEDADPNDSELKNNNNDSDVAGELWNYSNFVMLVGILTGSALNFLPISYLVLIVKFIYELKIIKTTADKKDVFGKAIKETSDVNMNSIHRFNPSKIAKISLIVSLFAVLIALIGRGIYLYFSYDKEEYEKYLSKKQWYESEPQEYGEDNVYVYEIHNQMPEWTGLRRETRGFLNTITGMDTGPRYKYMFFGDSDISWDGDSNFINKKGEIVTHIPFLERATVSDRQHVFRAIVEYCYRNKYDREDVFNYREITAERNEEQFGTIHIRRGPIFENGYVEYYSDFYDDYGLLKEDGTCYSAKYFICACAHNNLIKIYINGNDEIYNSNGKLLYKGPSYICNAGIILYDEKYTPENKNFDHTMYHVMDYEGNVIEGLYGDWNYERGGSFVSLHKYEDVDSIDYKAVAIYKGKVLFESDLYEDYDVKKMDQNGNITKIRARSKKGNEDVFLDAEGNIIEERDE
ncbi:hypothetical protein D6853_10615 [Butyrivibrio sp. X503]|uniref:hypothetical protein n=1 Tax=Butyrivibrio sp. X503 TaxID=2364878 RepID=UPI000EA8FDCE|nr:hypothetical protein [Butyrivibrio sp. X503]RKM55176.1 hypothetical protein D6853_10615 [Butyrivibrio sp. X503]